MNTFALGRLIVFAVLIPLAVVLGYLLASPESFMTVAVVGLVLSVLCLPVVLRWHHALLIVSWNAFINVFFLPGQPQLWLLLAAISLGVSILKRTLIPNFRFMSVRPVTLSLLFLALVVIVTAYARGGIGVRALGGGSHGGKGYFYILGAIAGYFALTAHRVPKEKAYLFGFLYFLGSITAAISNLAYYAGPAFYFLFLLFPADLAIAQAAADYTPNSMIRVSGLAPAAIAGCCFLLLRYGIKGMIDFRHWWRPVLFVATLGIGFFSGFRSATVIVGLLAVILFFLEGLHRTRALALVIALSAMFAVVMIPLANKLPLTVQRSLSFLPLPFDQAATSDAAESNQWRIQMWNAVIPQIPEYFWLGKGYALDPVALFMTQEAQRRGLAEGYESSLMAGDYHNGPLSLIIPFGIFGVVGFVWFIGAAGRVLFKNYRYGDPSFARLNTFLFAYFLMRVVFFTLVYGGFHAELFVFTGIVGLSVAINGGVCRPSKNVAPAVQRPAFPKTLSPITT